MQYVTHLHHVSLEFPDSVSPLDRLFEGWREKNSKKLEKFLVAAIPLMTSQRDVQYAAFERRLAEMMFFATRHRLLHVRLDGKLCFYHQNLRRLLFQTCTHPHIEQPPSITVLYDPSPSRYSPSFTLFCRYPKGKDSTVTHLSLCGNLSVQRSDVPLLIFVNCDLSSPA